MTIIDITTKCEICSKNTANLGTKRCDRCWELERRVKANPELTIKILNKILRMNKKCL